VAVGRVAEAKDYPNLLRAFGLVRERKPDARLWIVGEGEPLGKMAGVEWLGLQGDVARWLDGADGFVMSSAWEGMPLALGEAMAMGKVTVATDVGGVGEMLGDCGELVTAGESGALAEAMLKVMTMESGDREALGRRARLRVAEEFSLDSRVVVWEAMYQGLVRR
jgi:glycosyltransferase involved in cell wall biosynthesis